MLSLPRPLPHAVALALLAASVAGPVATAGAAAPWSAPATVPNAPATAPTVAFNAGGVGVITGDAGGGASSGGVGPNTFGTVADDEDAFPRPMVAFTATNFALGDRVGLYGLGRIAGLGTHFSSADNRAGIVFGTAGQKLTNVHFVGATDRTGAAEALAANPAATSPGPSGCARTPPAGTSRCTSSCARRADRSGRRCASTTSPWATSPRSRSTHGATSSSRGRPTAACSPASAPRAARSTPPSGWATRASRSGRSRAS